MRTTKGLDIDAACGRLGERPTAEFREQMADQFFGVIGGSGLYEMETESPRREVVIDTPYGAPSDALLF